MKVLRFLEARPCGVLTNFEPDLGPLLPFGSQSVEEYNDLRVGKVPRRALQWAMPLEPDELKTFLLPYPREVQELALKARLRLHELAGPASDLFFDATAAVCSGLSYTGKARDNFVNLAVYANHVTLIFPHGASLIDPEGRLRGEGSRVRNIRLASIETLKDPYVVGLIEQASAAAARPATSMEPIKVVSIYKGPKRRPKT